MGTNGTNPEEEEMNYAMLGEDESSTREKLEKYTGVIAWDYLRPHFEAGALLFVDPSLELTKVGEAIAKDDAVSVAGWRQTGDLLTPSEPHAEHWEKTGQTFRALVVSPFVLVQPVESASEGRI